MRCCTMCARFLRFQLRDATRRQAGVDSPSAERSQVFLCRQYLSHEPHLWRRHKGDTPHLRLSNVWIDRGRNVSLLGVTHSLESSGIVLLRLSVHHTRRRCLRILLLLDGCESSSMHESQRVASENGGMCFERFSASSLLYFPRQIRSIRKHPHTAHRVIAWLPSPPTS